MRPFACSPPPQQSGLRVRLLGGMAIAVHVGDLLHPAFRRPIATSISPPPSAKAARCRSSWPLRAMSPTGHSTPCTARGGCCSTTIPTTGRSDVFVGTFEMCHELPLDTRLELETQTLPLAELVLTKLQIVKLNQKDSYDLYSLLLTHEVANHDDEAINVAWIGELCGRDWGLYRTVQINLERLRTGLDIPELDPVSWRSSTSACGNSRPGSRLRPRPRSGSCAPAWATGSSGTWTRKRSRRERIERTARGPRCGRHRRGLRARRPDRAGARGRGGAGHRLRCRTTKRARRRWRASASTGTQTCPASGESRR